MNDSQLTKRLLNLVRPEGWKCPVNGPRKECIDLIVSDVKPVQTALHSKHHVLNHAIDLVGDRVQWRGPIRDTGNILRVPTSVPLMGVG